ncbi:MAG: DinB family protein [Candidatus Dormiibacterota bacterium]
MDRDAALADFEAARSEWAASFQHVPDEALAYLKPGDDYSLGGLQTHVNWVLVHYRRVLDGIIAGGFGELGPQDAPGEAEAAGHKAKLGMTSQERRAALDEMARLHSAVVAAVARLGDGDWGRKAPVVYAAGQDPYPTSSEDVIGWLRDHYREHVQQSADLVGAWKAGS